MFNNELLRVTHKGLDNEKLIVHDNYSRNLSIFLFYIVCFIYVKYFFNQTTLFLNLVAIKLMFSGSFIRNC